MTIIEMIKNLAQRNSVVASADVLAVFRELEAKDKRITELEAKMATPVRLPGFYKDADGNVWLNPVQVVKEIRRSGFTVDGDDA